MRACVSKMVVTGTQAALRSGLHHLCQLTLVPCLGTNFQLRAQPRGSPWEVAAQTEQRIHWRAAAPAADPAGAAGAYPQLLCLFQLLHCKATPHHECWPLCKACLMPLMHASPLLQVSCVEALMQQHRQPAQGAQLLHRTLTCLLGSCGTPEAALAHFGASYLQHADVR